MLNLIQNARLKLRIWCNIYIWILFYDKRDMAMEALKAIGSVYDERAAVSW